MLLFVIIILLVSLILGLIVLVQNPKGGGLSGTFGGVGNQLMGVKQTTDVLEKGTWVFAGLVAVLCILSPVVIPKSTNAASVKSAIDLAPATSPVKQATPPPAQLPVTNTQDTGKKP
jgi:preprotein translocase subunit SecG